MQDFVHHAWSVSVCQQKWRELEAEMSKGPATTAAFTPAMSDLSSPVDGRLYWGSLS